MSFELTHDWSSEYAPHNKAMNSASNPSAYSKRQIRHLSNSLAIDLSKYLQKPHFCTILCRHIIYFCGVSLHHGYVQLHIQVIYLTLKPVLTNLDAQ